MQSFKGVYIYLALCQQLGAKLIIVDIYCNEYTLDISAFLCYIFVMLFTKFYIILQGEKIMKMKLVAMLVLITLTASIMTVSVSAYGESIYSDYEAGELPENMFKTDREIKQQYYLPNGFVDCVLPSCPQDNNPMVLASKTENGYRITANGKADKVMTGTYPTDYTNAYGLYFDSRAIKSNNKNSAGTLISGDIAGGKNYVYSLQVRNRNSYITPKVHVRLYDSDIPSVLHSKEYGSAGMEITGTDWLELKGTIANTDDSSKTHTENNVDKLSIGFPLSTIAQSSVEINFIDSGEAMHMPYFAEEAAYDITNTLTAGAPNLEDGGQAEFKAEILNQVGLTGYLKQEFTWRVMNKDRTAVVDGFVITKGENGTATIKVNGAKAGTYDVVAYSEEYKMAKGVPITVRGEEVTDISIDNSVADKFTLKGVEVVKSDAKSILVVVASYTKAEGIKKIKDVGKAELTVKDGAVSLTHSITIDAPQGCDVRIFVWNASNLAPISLGDNVIAEYKIP